MNFYINMPEYNNTKRPEPEIEAKFKFRNKEDYDKFHQLVKKYIYDGVKVFDGMQKKHFKQAWFPLLEKASKYYYDDEDKPKYPNYPIYIVSKNRFKRNPTSRELLNMGVDFYMIVEKHEYEEYCNLVGKEKVLILPENYLNNYDKFWKDDDQRTGPGPARNFAWQHSIDNGHKWHWVLDDNIESFEIFNNNMKIKCKTPTIFWIAENFVNRFSNVGQAGFNYSFFCPANEARPPIKVNTRIYSCNLIKNDIPFRWRGRYNEDTDLSLRILKSGLCTIQFNSFLQGKRATQTMSGGNSAEFYENEGTYNKSKMLVDMHPDCAKLTKRWNRWHHFVNYNIFKHELILKKKYDNKNLVNNFGLIIKENKR